MLTDEDDDNDGLDQAVDTLSKSNSDLIMCNVKRKQPTFTGSNFLSHLRPVKSSGGGHGVDSGRNIITITNVIVI